MIHVLYGADTFSRSEAFDGLRTSLDEDGSLDTNTMRFSAADAASGEVVAACAAAPFLGGVRMVILEGLLRLGEEGGRRRNPATADQAVDAWLPLFQFAPQMPPSTTLVILDAAAGKNNPLLAKLTE